MTTAGAMRKTIHQLAIVVMQVSVKACIMRCKVIDIIMIFQKKSYKKIKNNAFSYLLQSKHNLQTSINTRKAHKGEREKRSRDEGYADSLESLRYG